MICVLSKIRKHITIFHLKISVFTAVKIRSILHIYACYSNVLLPTHVNVDGLHGILTNGISVDKFFKYLN